MSEKSVLYIVATPIGNLKDITLRALEVLREVDIIACEDARHTLKLLNYYEIKKHLISVHARNEREASNKVLRLLQDGKNFAYVSDAGTPSISDPGSFLVDEVRRAGFDVVPIPGVSAFSTLLSVAGNFGKGVHFEGFLSPKQGKRRRRLEELMVRDDAILLYESPYRLVKLLKDINDIDGSRFLVLGKELTKMHEKIIVASIQDILSMFLTESEVKGEFSLLILPRPKGCND